MILRSIASLAATLILATASLAQQPVPSPPATAKVSLNGHDITIKYGAPSMRGRKIMGGLVPYDAVWRTGANEATTFVTQAAVKIGDTLIPAGSYTLYTLPSQSKWLLLINKQTGQWGTVYNGDQDQARILMQSSTLSSPQEKMSISFENTQGSTTELHVKWENADEHVTITAQ